MSVRMQLPDLEEQHHYDKSKLVRLDAIYMVASFHTYFAEMFGFPEWYGHNMADWIDCMSSLDDTDEMVSNHRVAQGETIVFYVENYKYLKQHREICDDLIEGVSFVNYRRVESNYPPLIFLVFDS